MLPRFSRDSDFSADDLAQVLAQTSEPEALLRDLCEEARRRQQTVADEGPEEAFAFSRIVHTLGSGLLKWPNTAGDGDSSSVIRRDPIGTQHSVLSAQCSVLSTAGCEGPELSSPPLDAPQRLRARKEHGPFRAFPPELLDWLRTHRLHPGEYPSISDWAHRARAAAFEALRRTIVASGGQAPGPVQSSLRSDELVWGRAPARLDLAGGWTDTPPYSLERGGAVLNAAVLLNGQPPVQVYARVAPEPAVRLRSIDLGTQLDINSWDDLLDYSSADGEFSLVKGALVLSGFTPSAGAPRAQTSEVLETSEVLGSGSTAPPNRTLQEVLTAFGGGIEITTLAAIPKGSGLGTSSIMGAVLLAVIHRVLGRQLSPTGLFHAVLRLEQELSTGGGWQDQIGGTVGGLKLITTPPGLVPEAAIRYVPADVLDPGLNGGQTLLYYTGMTRLAKNILQNVVGRYLDRDREAMSALRQLRELASNMAEAAARKDLPQFGRLIDAAWRLNKILDPHSTTEEIEALLAQIAPHIHGAKLLGAGGGGFLLLVCRSPEAAAEIRRQLETAPPNPRARFFDFEPSPKGLEISVC